MTRGTEAELNARQRKNVYMHSTIFDAEGPSTKSVYAPSRQAELHGHLKPSLRHNNTAPPEMDMPSAADIRCTHNAGHNVVHPNASPNARGGYPSERGPRTTTHNHIVADGEAIPVVSAAGRDGAIPREFWTTSVSLQWHDDRSGSTSCRKAAFHTKRGEMNAQGLKLQELSSEVFGNERLTQVSTIAPRKELLAGSADHMRVDSSLDVNSQPCHEPLSQSHAYGNHNYPLKKASHRFANNLSHSQGNTMGQEDGEGQPMSSPPGDRVLDEDPSNIYRRRREKNFSDLFGANSGEYKSVRGQREEVTATKTCSFLDTRSEIATRNKAQWKTDETQQAVHRKEAERSSDLFERECPGRPEMEPQHREVHANERACWDTKDVMQSGSEIARRRRQNRENGWHVGEKQTALQRKQEDMASTQIRVGLNQGQHFEAPHDPKSSFKQQYGRMAEPINAKDTRLASLQSSIFT